jgi:TonB family protein
MDDTRATDQMPQTIGRYQVQDSVGFGAMGAVYKAFDPLIKRTLAIKTIRLDIPRQSPQYKSFIERFYHEARISGTLSHPNIVTLFDIGEEGGLPYLAMEFVEGETIASILDRGVKFKPERVINLVSQIASAVDYAHGKGVIHRDIKPSNLILYDGERVKVTDFGIAKLVDTEMTQSGTLLGTPSYMSPEQAMGEKLDGRSDIFSLGVCAFEMLSGEQPFPGSNVTAILYKLVHADPVEPVNLELNGLVPQKWHQVFNRVLAKQPDDRYQSATDFVQDLEYCLGAWFGSAMGEETISESADPGGQTVAVSASAVASGMRDVAGAGSAPGIDDTPPVPQQMPPPVPPMAKTVRVAAAKTQPPVPLKQADDENPQTVSFKPMRADEIPVPPGRSPAPAPPPSVPPSAEDSSTVVLKAPPVLRPPAPTPAAAPAASDVNTVMLKPAAPPPRPVAPRPTAAKPPASEPPPGPTVVMGSADVTRRATPPVRTPARPPAARQTPAPSTDASPRSTAPKKRPPLAAILGGVGVLLLVGAIATGVVVYRKFAGGEPEEVRPPAPPVTSAPARARVRTPAPVAAVGTLHVESQPPGATVTVDGQERGVTPAFLVDVTYGAHEVKVELKGHAPVVETVVLSADASAPSMSLSLSKTAPATGAAEISSEPSGATVRIDGTPVGQTPYADPRMKTGTHRVEVLKDGFEPWSGTVSVQAGKRARVDARLRSTAFSTPTPAPAVVDVDRIYVNSPAEVDTPARKLSGMSASYPTDRGSRLKSGNSVSVRLSFVVTETGEVTDIRVVESAGRLVDEAVLTAVRTWKYSPAVKNETKVKVRVDFRQTFRAS